MRAVQVFVPVDFVRRVAEGLSRLGFDASLVRVCASSVTVPASAWELGGEELLWKNRESSATTSGGRRLGRGVVELLLGGAVKYDGDPGFSLCVARRLTMFGGLSSRTLLQTRHAASRSANPSAVMHLLSFSYPCRCFPLPPSLPPSLPAARRLASLGNRAAAIGTP